VEDDGALPPAGGVFLYDVTAVNCRGESSLGRDSAGGERTNASPCP